MLLFNSPNHIPDSSTLLQRLQLLQTKTNPKINPTSPFSPPPLSSFSLFFFPPIPNLPSDFDSPPPYQIRHEPAGIFHRRQPQHPPKERDPAPGPPSSSTPHQPRFSQNQEATSPSSALDSTLRPPSSPSHRRPMASTPHHLRYLSQSHPRRREQLHVRRPAPHRPLLLLRYRHRRRPLPGGEAGHNRKG